MGLGLGAIPSMSALEARGPEDEDQCSARSRET
jgi:hypothetical protein